MRSAACLAMAAVMIFTLGAAAYADVDDDTVLVDSTFTEYESRWYGDILSWPFDSDTEEFDCTLSGSYTTTDNVVHSLDGTYTFVLANDDNGSYVYWLPDLEYTSLRFFPLDYDDSVKAGKMEFKGEVVLGVTLQASYSAADPEPTVDPEPTATTSPTETPEPTAAPETTATPSPTIIPFVINTDADTSGYSDFELEVVSLLGYILAILIFFTVICLCYFVYKFFRMFF